MALACLVRKRTTLATSMLRAFPTPAFAADGQYAKGDGIGTTVVGASRHAQSLLDVPVSMSFLDAEVLVTEELVRVQDARG